MYIISLFEHSLKLELAISELEQNHISKEDILALSIDKSHLEKKYLDPYNADGLNLFLVSCLAMISMLLGAIYGFVLYWGPILWALIGLIVGTATGLLADYCIKKVNRKHTIKKHIIDVLLFVKCDAEKFKMVEEILSKHHSLGMARITNERRKL